MQMEYLDPQFVWPDALILLAIIFNHYDNGATLRDIVSCSDYIDKSYPSSQELEEALNRLLAAGLIIVHGDKYDVTEAVYSQYQQNQPAGHSARKQVEAVELILSSVPQPQSCPKNIVIEESVLQAAIAEYIASF